MREVHEVVGKLLEARNMAVGSLCDKLKSYQWGEVFDILSERRNISPELIVDIATSLELADEEKLELGRAYMWAGEAEAHDVNDVNTGYPAEAQGICELAKGLRGLLLP